MVRPDSDLADFDAPSDPRAQDFTAFIVRARKAPLRESGLNAFRTLATSRVEASRSASDSQAARLDGPRPSESRASASPTRVVSSSEISGALEIQRRIRTLLAFRLRPTVT